ncbi:hypothetical protein [Frigoribacterium sp. CG_9.8]|uniref:hypothetical protein n=1 Tax=Frigoribacterium sp. CG_9.8 TaxID=2787733 RepID=UPI0018C95022|nr:hypothetical protein [Frigoribacterium sp. CG_9.8]MBG6106581.1 hypothetical protein [Frigoribacterium sp. CG_9.8]
MKCKHPGTNHSTDITTVWHGAPAPLTLCGYHASKISPATFAELRATGVIK